MLAHPHVDPRHRADLPGLDDLDHAAIVVAGVDLRAHLRDGLALGGLVAHLPHFVHRMRQRLLAIHVQPALQSRHHRDRRAYGRASRRPTRVEVLLLVEHLAKIDVGLRLGKSLGHLAQVQRIDVAQGHDVFALQVVDVVGALVGHADAGQVQFFVRAAGRQRALRGAKRAGRQRRRARQNRLPQEFAPLQDART